jgi:uncharacterized protein YgiM (DUF1202 family)
LRKGRCSNDPKNCTLALGKVELPYAGVDSICPECSAPLAALAGSTQSYEAASPSQPVPTYVKPVEPAAPTKSYNDDYSRRMERDPEPSYQDNVRRPSYDYDAAPPQRDNAMKLTQMVIVGAAIALIGFFAWRMFLQPRQVEAPDSMSTTNTTGVGGGQVTQISPAQMRRVNVAAEARTIPDPMSAIIATLPAGSLLDVTGQVQVSGVNWLRITLPNDSSKSGFVREDQMASLGDGGLTISPMDPMAQGTLPGTVPGTGVPSPAVPEVIGPIQAREASTFYIASRQANIRQEANVGSGKVGAYEFNDAVTVIGQRSVGARIWYQVQLPSGGTGWISGRLVGTAPRDVPVDAPAAADPKLEKVAPKPNQPNDGPNSEIGKRDNQEALSAYGPGTTLRVDATTANLRKEPGATGNSVVEPLGRDTLMSVEDVRIVNGVPWYRVTSPNGAQGWISGRTVVENK